MQHWNGISPHPTKFIDASNTHWHGSREPLYRSILHEVWHQKQTCRMFVLARHPHSPDHHPEWGPQIGERLRWLLLIIDMIAAATSGVGWWCNHVGGIANAGSLYSKHIKSAHRYCTIKDRPGQFNTEIVYMRNWASASVDETINKDVWAGINKWNSPAWPMKRKALNTSTRMGQQMGEVKVKAEVREPTFPWGISRLSRFSLDSTNYKMLDMSGSGMYWTDQMLRTISRATSPCMPQGMPHDNRILGQWAESIDDSRTNGRRYAFGSTIYITTKTAKTNPTIRAPYTKPSIYTFTNTNNTPTSTSWRFWR